MGAGVGGGDEGLGKLAILASLAILRAFNLEERIDSGVSTFFGIGSGDLRCFSIESYFTICTISFQDDVGWVFIYSVSESATDDVRSALSRARSALSELGGGVDGIFDCNCDNQIVY